MYIIKKNMVFWKWKVWNLVIYNFFEIVSDMYSVFGLNVLKLKFFDGFYKCLYFIISENVFIIIMFYMFKFIIYKKIEFNNMIK